MNDQSLRPNPYGDFEVMSLIELFTFLLEFGKFSIWKICSHYSRYNYKFVNSKFF